MDEFNIPFEFENTTVRILSSHLRLGGRRDPDPLLFMLTRPVPSPGPPPNDHGRQRPPAIRTHTTPICPSFQRYVARWGSTEGSRAGKRIRAER
jgi:hypothetical protein